MAKKRISKSRKKSYLKRNSRRKSRQTYRRKDKCKIKKTRKKNKRGGGDIGLLTGIRPSELKRFQDHHNKNSPTETEAPGLEPTPQSEPDTAPETQSLQRSLEDPKQIEEYVLRVLISHYNSLTPDERIDIFKASLLYSHQYDGFHNVLIRNYHNNSGKVDIKLFDETLVKKSNELSPSFLADTNYLYGAKLLDECRAANEILIAELNTTKVITPKFCVERCSSLHNVMKNNCLTLDRNITVYRGLLIGGSTQYLDGFNTKLNGFSSTTYMKQYSIEYILNVMLGKSISPEMAILSDVFEKIISEQLSDTEFPDFDFSEILKNIRILKITLPPGTKVFNTDICGKGETELTLLDEGGLNIISEEDITPNNDTEFKSLFDDKLLNSYHQLRYTNSMITNAIENNGLFKQGETMTYNEVGKMEREKREFMKKIKNKKIDRDKFRLKQVECNFVPHEEQKNYSEVLFDPLIAELSKES
jgi:hypothetical protein